MTISDEKTKTRFRTQASGPLAGEFDTGSKLELSRLEVTLVGAGRSGSQIAIVLAMLGIRLLVYDHDRLGPENQARQLYRRAAVRARRLKVEALRDLVRDLVPRAPFQPRAERFEARADQERSPIVVLAVDTMRERRVLWKKLRSSSGLLLLLDVRLGIGVVRAHKVLLDEPSEIADYEVSLHGDSEEAELCSADATAHAATASAALVAGQLCAFAQGIRRESWMVLDLDRGICASHALSERDL